MDERCDILIVGGGIDGAIANHYLSKQHNTILVEKNRLGCGCTSCATALLEYQLDDFAKDLQKCMTTDQIVKSYKMGLQSIERIANFVGQYGNHCQFARRPTLIYTSDKSAQKDIESEFAFRKSNGFECELITPKNNPFPFEICRGILAENGGCEFNPYLFEKMMIETAPNQNKIFENTSICHLKKTQSGWVATTEFGEKIICKIVIIATGFDWEVLGNADLCQRFVSYSIVTEPIKNFEWHKNAMIHDANEPYHYLRILPDGRLIFGGEDTPFKNKPIEKKTAQKKYAKLQKDLLKLFPSIKNAKIDHKFCGFFGTTKNNLGLIGQSKFDDNLWLFLSCGANGIINAMSGIDILLDLCNGKKSNLSDIFSPRRTAI